MVSLSCSSNAGYGTLLAFCMPHERAGNTRCGCIAWGHYNSQLLQLAALLAVYLWVGLGAADGGHDGQFSACSRGFVLGLEDGLSERPGGIGVGAVTEHYVEEHDGHLRVGGFLEEAGG